MTGPHYDILVIGGGNAAVSAAITARRMGRSVLVLEAAPRDFRGGNTRHTRNFRCMHTKPLDDHDRDATRRTSTGTICCASPAARPTSSWRA